LSTGAVKTLAGGSRDPKDLFCFGDQDSAETSGKDARFQHPLGVAWSPNHSLLFVADSYNHKIKVVDVPSGKTKTVYGGDNEQRSNSEFGGLCCFQSDAREEMLLVADTNQHRLLVGKLNKLESKLDLRPFIIKTKATQEVASRVLPKKDSADKTETEVSNVEPKKEVQDNREWLEKKTLKLGGQLGLNFDVLLEKGVKLNPEAPQKLSYKVVQQSTKMVCNDHVLSFGFSFLFE
jgi:hypothetical protein